MKILLTGFGWIFLRSKEGCVFYSCDGSQLLKQVLKASVIFGLQLQSVNICDSKEWPCYPIIRRQREYTGSVTIFCIILNLPESDRCSPTGHTSYPFSVPISVRNPVFKLMSLWAHFHSEH